MKFIRILGMCLVLAACSPAATTDPTTPIEPTKSSEVTTTAEVVTTGAATATTTATTQALTTTAGQGNTATAGNYTFADVQVSEDFAGDFEVRTRATNNGGTQGLVGLTVTLFLDGSIVGVGEGYVSDWAASDTQTVTFVSFDEYTEWNTFDFQVDSEF